MHAVISEVLRSRYNAAVSNGQAPTHQGQQLISRIRPTGHISQVNVVVHQLTQSRMMGQSGRQDQPGISHQAVVVEDGFDAVRIVAWEHPLGAPRFGPVSCFKTIIRDAESTFSFPQYAAVLIFLVGWD